MNRILVAALFFSLFNFGCAPIEKNDFDKDPKASLFKSAAAGTWVTDCDSYIESGSNNSRSRVKKLVLREKEATLSDTTYGNLNCKGSAIDSTNYDATMKVVEEPTSEKSVVVEFQNKSPADYHFYRQKMKLELSNLNLKATILGMSTLVDGKEIALEESDFSNDKYSEYSRPQTAE